jgi:uncharacterized surface anchored protein
MNQTPRKTWLATVKKNLAATGRQPRRVLPQMERLEDRTVPASITGHVFADLDADGILDAEEFGVGGVTLILRDSNGNVAGTTATAADGSYAFNGLAAGKYSVQEVQPNGLGSTTPNVLSLDLPDAGLTDQNFGERFASLAGKVYYDANNNGVQDTGEPGLAGVKIQLTGTDANNLSVDRTVFTGADGSYLFNNLLGGVYTITETTPDKFTDGLDSVGSAGGTIGNDIITSVPLLAGVSGTGYNFGERGIALAGIVFQDADRNGQFGNSEKGVAGVVLTLRDKDGNLVATTTTGTDGSYIFGGLTAGNYTVTETQPAGYGSSTANVRSNVDVTSNGIAGQNFGETLGSLGGKVYIDANNNGKIDTTEQGIANVTITLTGTDIFGNAVNQTATTGADGTYNFTNLFSGTYVVTETQPNAFTDGKDTLGTVNGILRGKLGNDTVTNIVLPEGRTAINYNFGEKLTTATGKTFITGTVFFDKNNNGRQDADETGIEGVTITLKDPNSTVVGTTKTDSRGFYGFFDIAFDTKATSHTYTLEETQPEGFDSNSSDTIVVTLPQTGLTNQNFAEVTSSFAGQVYLDLNNNGFRDVNEPAIGGVLITLTGTETTSNKSVSLTTTTGVDGKYSFTNLRAGTYTIQETQPLGFADGQDRTGTSGGTLADDKVSSITLGTGVNATGYDFGEVSRGVSGVVYVDLNNNGLQDAGEPGIAGVAILLEGTDTGGNEVTRKAFTANDGSYSFTDLAPGTYSITETQPSGWTDGQDRVGSLGGSLGNDQFTSIGIGSSSLGNGYLFGERGTVIAGKVFQDVDRDSVADPTEKFLSGVILTLRDHNGVVVGTTLSDTNGAYVFGPLAVGDYTVEMTLPSGYGSLNDTNNGPHDLTHQLTVPAEGVTNDLFAVTVGSLSGVVYRDLNNNGIQDAEETGIAGVLITLTGTDVNGVSVTQQATTGTDGSYRFSGLLAGKYTLTETAPGGSFYDGIDTAGTINGNAAGTVGSDAITDITLAQGLDGINFRFGEVPAGSISGFVFIDTNNNGKMDPATTDTKTNTTTPAEQGISGVTVTISGTRFDGQALTAADVPGGLTRVTGTDGFYDFGTLPPGVYAIHETQPAGFADGNEQIGDATFNDGLPADQRAKTATDDFFTNIRLDASGDGQIRGSFNFGELPPASVSGLAFVDRNNNGVRDAGERILAGVLVKLQGKNDLGNNVTLTTRSDTRGQFTFENLRPSGTEGYTLSWVSPFGFVAGKAKVGKSATAQEDDPPLGTIAATKKGPISHIVLGAGVQAVGYQLGFLIPGTFRLVF